MGILDFVKSGVREMMIARPEDNGDLIYKHPDRTIPMFAQCTVRADEWAVFAKEGRPAGTLDAGRHTLSAASIPFLSNLIDSVTGGNILLSELFFVKRTPFPMRFGGSLGNMIDPMTQIRIRGRCHGELLLRVENPEKMIYGYFGMRDFQNHPDIFNWLTDRFFMTVKSTLGKVAHDQRRSLIDVMDLTEDLGNSFVQNCQALNDVGVRIAQVTKLEIDVPEEDLKRFDEMRQKVAEQMVGLQADEIGIQRAALQAQAEAARAQVGVQTAGYQAQAAQFKMDQQYQQDARYVQNLAGSYQGFAAGEAMRGAGQGMAQGGGATGNAGAMAQLGMGVGIANAYAQGAMAQGPQFNTGGAPRVGVPGAPAAGVVAVVACGSCGAQVPNGKFCAECGSPVQAAGPKHCTGCAAELAPNAKFCAECGTPSAAAPKTPPAAPPQQG
jgi:hypothetical protein